MNQQDRTIVIVDYQNVRRQAEKLEVSLTRLASALWEKAKTLPGVVDIRLFTPILRANLHWSQVNALALKHGFSIEACPYLREGSMRKDVVDFVIFRWLMRYASLAEHFVFVTGDGDFIIAATTLKLQGKDIQIWSFDANTTSEVLFTTLEVQVLPLQQEVPRANQFNRYALAVEKLFRGQEISPSEIELLERLVEPSNWDEQDLDLLNTIEGLGIRQSPKALQALKGALELKKGGT